MDNAKVRLFDVGHVAGRRIPSRKLGSLSKSCSFLCLFREFNVALGNITITHIIGRWRVKVHTGNSVAQRFFIERLGLLL